MRATCRTTSTPTVTIGDAYQRSEGSVSTATGTGSHRGSLRHGLTVFVVVLGWGVFCWGQENNSPKIQQDTPIQAQPHEGTLASDGEHDQGTKLSAYVPLTSAEKRQEALHGIFSMRFSLMTASIAGIQQGQNNPAQWGQGFDGYADRFASFWGQRLLYSTAMYGTSVLFHEDPRRVYSQKQGFAPRFADAIRLSFLSRRDNGTLGFAYSRTLSITSARLIAYTWYPDGYSSTEKPFQQIGVALTANCALGVAHEFMPDVRKRLVRLMPRHHGTKSGSP